MIAPRYRWVQILECQDLVKGVSLGVSIILHFAVTKAAQQHLVYSFQVNKYLDPDFFSVFEETSFTSEIEMHLQAFW